MSVDNLYIFLLAYSPIFSLLCIALWGLFISVFLPALPSPKRLVTFSFLLGIACMLAAFLVENLAVSTINIDFYLTSDILIGFKNAGLIAPLAYSVIVAAIIEETIKFLVIKKVLDASKSYKITDGITVGLWIGFGFAFIENIFYYMRFLDSLWSIWDVGAAFLIRGALSTLAHGLYGAIMGYYLSLAKMHRLYRSMFLETALITCIWIHGVFNFFLVTFYGYLSIIFVAAILAVVLAWYNDRRNIEIELPKRLEAGGRLPYLAHKYEVEAVLSSQNTPMSAFSKILSWFP